MMRSELESGMIILTWFDKRPELALSTLTCGSDGVDVWSAEIAVYEGTEHAKERIAP